MTGYERTDRCDKFKKSMLCGNPVVLTRSKALTVCSLAWSVSASYINAKKSIVM